MYGTIFLNSIDNTSQNHLYYRNAWERRCGETLENKPSNKLMLMVSQFQFLTKTTDKYHEQDTKKTHEMLKMKQSNNGENIQRLMQSINAFRKGAHVHRTTIKHSRKLKTLGSHVSQAIYFANFLNAQSLISFLLPSCQRTLSIF